MCWHIADYPLSPASMHAVVILPLSTLRNVSRCHRLIAPRLKVTYLGCSTCGNMTLRDGQKSLYRLLVRKTYLTLAAMPALRMQTCCTTPRQTTALAKIDDLSCVIAHPSPCRRLLSLSLPVNSFAHARMRPERPPCTNVCPATYVSHFASHRSSTK